jgi:phasin family protein
MPLDCAVHPDADVGLDVRLDGRAAPDADARLAHRLAEIDRVLDQAPGPIRYPIPAMFPFANVVHAPWGYFKLPVSIETLLETHRKNAAAWTNASDVAFDALSTLAERQRDLLKTTVDQYGKVATDVMTSQSLTERTTRHADAVRHICDSTVIGFRDLGDIATKASVDAADILSTRLNEGFDELKALFSVPASRAPASATLPATAASVGLPAIPTNAKSPATTEPVEAQEVTPSKDAEEAEVEVEVEPNLKAAPRARRTTESVKAARTTPRR